MKDKEAQSVMTFKNINGNALMPVDELAHEFMQNHSGKVLGMKEVTARDLRFHKAYFALLGFIWSWGTPAFRRTIPKDDFYLWLKLLQGKYEVKYSFKSGIQFIKYESISFSRMTQAKFRDYVRAQLPVIYTEFIGAMYKDEDKVSMIISTIEFEFENYLEQL